MQKYILQTTFLVALSLFFPVSINAKEIKDPFKLTADFYLTATKEISASVVNKSKQHVRFFAPLFQDSVHMVSQIGNTYLSMYKNSLESAKIVSELSWKGIYTIGDVAVSGLEQSATSLLYSRQLLSNALQVVEDRSYQTGQRIGTFIASQKSIPNPFLKKEINLTASVAGFWNTLIDKISDPFVPLFQSKPVISSISGESTGVPINSNDIIPNHTVSVGQDVSHPSSYTYVINNNDKNLLELRLEFLTFTKNLLDYVDQKRVRQAEKLGDSISDSTDEIDGSTITDSSFSGTANLSELTVDTNTLVVDSVNNRIGIGTSSPFATFSVNGDISLTGRLFDSNGSVGTSGYILQTTGSGVTWVAPSSLGISGAGTAGQVAYYETNGTTVSGTSTLFIHNNKIGIGTTSPAEKLGVVGNIGISVGGIIGSGVGYTGQSGASSYATLQLYNTSDGYTSLNNQGFGIKLMTSGTDRITILQNGAVGIGDSSPTYELDVVGDIALTEYIEMNDAYGLHWSSVGSGAYITANSGSSDISLGNVDQFTINTSTLAGGSGAWTIDSSGNFSGTAASATSASVGASSGNVVAVNNGGVVYDDNGTPLQVANLSNLTTDNLTQGSTNRYSQWATNVSSIYYNSGSVGIGISAPQSKLSVKGQGHTAPWLTAERSSATTMQFKIYGAETTGYTAQSGTVSPTWTNVIENSNSNIMLSTVLQGGTGGNIILDGKVGIGTTAPDELLHVSTTTVAAGAHIGNAFVGVWQGSGSYMGISHYSLKGNSLNYAMYQSNTGATYIGSASGQVLNFRPGGTDNMSLSGTQIAFGGTVSGTASKFQFYGTGTSGTTAPILMLHNTTDDSATKNGGITTRARMTSRYLQTSQNLGFNDVSFGNAGVVQYTALEYSDAYTTLATPTEFTGWSYQYWTGAAYQNLFRIHTSGIGIGMASANTVPGAKLHVISTASNQFRSGYDTSNYWSASTTASGLTVFSAVGSSPAFNFANNVGIGTTSPYAKLSVVGQVVGEYFTATSSTLGFNASNLLGGATNLTVDANGNIIRDPSDARLKEDIETIIDPLEKIEALRGVTYYWKDKDRFGYNQEIGMIAQEVEQVVPQVVSSGGEYKSLNIKNLVALLIEGVKVLKQKLDTIIVWFEDNKFNIKGQVCVDDVCVSKEQFKSLLLNAGGSQINEIISDDSANEDEQLDISEESDSTSSEVDEGTSSQEDDTGSVGSSETTVPLSGEEEQTTNTPQGEAPEEIVEVSEENNSSEE